MGAPNDGPRVVRVDAPHFVELGPRRYDVTTRALVMGIVNRTPDSFYDRGATFDLSRALARAERLVTEGADVIDVGGVKAGGGDDVTATEELDRVVPTVATIAERLDVAISVDTWRAEVAAAAYAAGAVLGNDISGFADPAYLGVAARHGASVVATHIRLRPRVDDPDPRYPDDDVVGAVEHFLADRLEMALLAGIPRARVLFDVGLDLGKTTPQSLELLRALDRFAAMGQTLLLSASNKGFLGELLGLAVDEREDASLAAVAFGVARGCRVVRVHDAARARRAVDALAAVLAA
ncbi:MAG TPA: dihydropteroate synthase [Acidimicrobiales bacterium]|nr:dihydropteroate synthase [Acidimicrobiales bacterium]